MLTQISIKEYNQDKIFCSTLTTRQRERKIIPYFGTLQFYPMVVKKLIPRCLIHLF